VGANYGPAFVSHMEGRKRGYDQILWLLNNSKEFEVTEAGASNFFLVWESKEGKLELVTAPLDSKIILDGVTRRSVLELARERLIEGSKYLTPDIQSIEVVERTYTMLEVEEAWREGRLVEAFLSGTAVSVSILMSEIWLTNCKYFITPVSAINFHDEDLELP
jgi:branched-chain amino acid aminotransferase